MPWPVAHLNGCRMLAVGQGATALLSLLRPPAVRCHRPVRPPLLRPTPPRRALPASPLLCFAFASFISASCAATACIYQRQHQRRHHQPARNEAAHPPLHPHRAGPESSLRCMTTPLPARYPSRHRPQLPVAGGYSRLPSFQLWVVGRLGLTNERRPTKTRIRHSGREAVLALIVTPTCSLCRSCFSL